MPKTINQRAFSTGELDPQLWGHSDLAKHASAVRTARNVLVNKRGMLLNRPGTRYIAQVKDSTKTARLIPFKFGFDQQYVLEFGDLYVRFYQNGEQILETAKVVTNITNANPGVVTSNAHGFNNGDEVHVELIVGALGQYLNGRNFKVANKTANTFTLQYLDGTDVNTTGLGAYTSAGTAARVYTLISPYIYTDLPELRFSQSFDVMVLTHNAYPSYELIRSGQTNWSLSLYPLIPNPAPVAGGSPYGNVFNITGMAGASGSVNFFYKVTQVNLSTGEESFPGALTMPGSPNVNSISNANPCVIGATAHGFVKGQQVILLGVGVSQLNKRVFNITVVDADHFSLNGIDSTNYDIGTGGNAVATELKITGDVLSVAVMNKIDFDCNFQNSYFKVYRSMDAQYGGRYGFVGTTTTFEFLDSGIVPDMTDVPPDNNQILVGAGNYPAASAWYQQRLIFFNTNNNPQGLYASRIGKRTNFTTRNPIQPDDAIIADVASNTLSRIWDAVDSGFLILLTDSGPFIVGGDQTGTLTPTEINIKKNAFAASAHKPRPLHVIKNVLHVEANNRTIRDLQVLTTPYYTHIAASDEISIFSNHLFDGHSIVAWDYQQYPDSVIWAVREDGKLISITYVKEQELAGFTVHDTDGNVEDVCCVQEGNETFAYFAVKRTINNATMRTIERMSTRYYTDIRQANFLDGSVFIDGTNASSTTMTLTGALYVKDSIMTLTASAAFFLAGDIGNAIWLYDNTGLLVRATITAFTNSTVVSVQVDRDVPVTLRGNATAVWGKAIVKVTGLWNLEGKTVAVYADAFVIANPQRPNNATLLTVSNGAITLPTPHVVVRVGLPFYSDVLTLSNDNPQDETTIDKKQNINRVTVNVVNTRTIWAGANSPDNEPNVVLTENKMRDTEQYDQSVMPFTGTKILNIAGEWTYGASVFLRNLDPTPMAVTNIASRISLQGS